MLYKNSSIPEMALVNIIPAKVDVIRRYIAASRLQCINVIAEISFESHVGAVSSATRVKAGITDCLLDIFAIRYALVLASAIVHAGICCVRISIVTISIGCTCCSALSLNASIGVRVIYAAASIVAVAIMISCS
jgi:hypothetical protein